MKKNGPTLQAGQLIERERQPGQAAEPGAACRRMDFIFSNIKRAQACERWHAGQRPQPVVAQVKLPASCL